MKSRRANGLVSLVAGLILTLTGCGIKPPVESSVNQTFNGPVLEGQARRIDRTLTSGDRVLGTSRQIEFLRYFRDTILNKSPAGKEIITLYYQWSPVIVKAMEEDEDFKEDVKEMADGILELIGEVE